MATANATVRAVLDYLNEKSSSSVPTGAICYFATTAIPTGWLLCNGSNVSRTTYKALFAAIGTKFGTGNGSSTFTLPNLDERFIEGTTTTSDVGKKLEAGLPNITGTFDANRAFIVNYTTGSSGAIKSHRVVQQDWDGIGSGNSTTGSGFDLNAAWSNELFGASLTVQPKSLLFLPCIKI